jgi:hypothetical protein
MVLAVLLVVLVVLVLLPSGVVTKADSVEVARPRLLDAVADLTVVDCTGSFDGSAVVHFPTGRFDADQLVEVTAADPAGWASGGGVLFPSTRTIVRVHVPAGTAIGAEVVTVTATGVRHGRPVRLQDALTVRVRCSAL